MEYYFHLVVQQVHSGLIDLVESRHVMRSMERAQLATSSWYVESILLKGHVGMVNPES